MINPDDIAQAVNTLIHDNRSTVGNKDEAVLSEDQTSQLKPPYCGVFADFEIEAEGMWGNDVLQNLPAEIKILVCSSKNKTAAESIAECLTIAEAVITLCRKSYTVGTETVQLHIRPRPFEWLSKKADQSVLQINFYFYMVAL